MAIFEIICLASSIKNNGLCIAGLKIDGSGWLRPISQRSDGALDVNDYILDNNCKPKIFDILRIECSEHRPSCHQPKNWIISNKKWEFVGISNDQQIKEIIEPERQRNSSLSNLLGDLSDKIQYELLQQQNASSSLACVRPENIIYWSVGRYDVKKNYRVIFSLNQNTYNLKITDPNWIDKMNKAEFLDGKYSSEEIINRLQITNCEPKNFNFTISLGEPFKPTGYENKYCYKMIAAVIIL